jgi:integrase
MKEPQNILPTFTDKQIRSLVDWKPKGRIERRLHLILLCLFDTGARIGEILKLRVSDTQSPSPTLSEWGGCVFSLFL